MNQAAVSWLSSYPALTLTGASIHGTLVTVDVAGSTSPPSTTSLAQALTGVLGPTAAVQVQWFQTTSATSTRSEATLSLTLGQIQPVVQKWLSDEASTLNIVKLAKHGSSVSVTLAGSTAPPSANQLAKAISNRAGQAVTVSVTWQTPSPATAPSAGPPSDVQKAETALSQWISVNPGLEVLGVSDVAGTVTIDLAGSSRSAVNTALQQAISTAVGPGVPVTFRFAELQPVTLPTPTPTQPPSGATPTTTPTSPTPTATTTGKAVTAAG